MKRPLQAAIRRLHLLWPRELPDRLAIYFHNLQRLDWQQFQEAVAFLRERDYEIVGPREFVEMRGRRVAYLSFDDNFRDWHEALPLLQRLEVQATFYLNTMPLRDRASASDIADYFRRIDQDPGSVEPLSSSEIAEISGAGHHIGAHTHSHFSLTSLDEDTARREITESRDLLADIVGKEIVHFSYPFGMRRHFSQTLRRLCIVEGFETVANAIPGMQFAKQELESIHRTPWNLARSLDHNIEGLSIDGRLFERATGRAATAG